ncbi:recombinase family protein [Streptomyces sp. BI20]|uniref:recombinase family protein n=1 Tax=Streptomyces sp. BI20 TaxID=3403460 RepID=UPI003C781321
MSGTGVYCACYIRQSRKKANKSEASPEDQRDKTKGYTTEKGFNFVDFYEDIGKSGYDPDAERKGFDRMMNDARVGRINMIVVHYASRFSRQNINIVLMQVLELFQLGVRIVSVNEGEFTSDNVMELMNIIMRFEAGHNESRNKSIAVRGTFEKHRERGGWLGGHAPFGFEAYKEFVDGVEIQRLRPREEEAKVIQWCWATIKKHRDEPIQQGKRHPGSLAGLVHQMHLDDVPTRGKRIGGVQKHAKWEVTTLNRILRDPRLAGYMAEPNTKGEKAKWAYRIQRNEDGTAKKYDYAPIIPVDEWWELQAWLDSRGQGRGLTRGTSLLSALRNPEDEPILMCACDKSMCAYYGGGTSPSPSYRCNFRNVPGHNGNNTMVQHHLDEYVARRIFARIIAAEEDGDTAGFLLEATKRFARTQESPSNARERAQLVTERHEAAQRLVECEEDYKAVKDKGPATRRAVLEEMDAAETRLKALDDALQTLAEADAPALPIQQWINSEEGNGDPMGEGSWWATATLESKRRFVALFVDRIVVHKSAMRGNRWVQYDASKRVSLTFAGEGGTEEASEAA